MRRKWVLAAALLLAGCIGPAGSSVEDGTDAAALAWPTLPVPHPDPLADGPLAWTTQDYHFGSVRVGGPDAQHSEYDYAASVTGVLSVPDGPGPYPLAVFLHGQHSTCSGSDGREGSNCDVPYRNDLGYLYLMEHLASHGVATASILATEINRQNGAGDTGMWARGELVLATIDALADSEHASRLDFGRIGLMGHSRGGEGVVTAVEVNDHRPVPRDISSVIALAPTDFAYRNVPAVPFLVLVPFCDGDVYNLHGLRQFDQSRFVDREVVKVQLLVMGANHNNYNTNWGRGYTSPVTGDGDDASFGRHQNPECDLSREDGGGRLTLEDTYAEAILHMGGFLRWTLLGHDGLAPFFLGADQPGQACPGGVPSCPGAVLVSTMTPDRRDLFWAESSGVVAADGVSVPDAPVCQLSGCGPNVYSSAWMADVRILDEAMSFDIRFDTPTDMRKTPVLQVRVAVPTAADVNAFGPPRMTVTFHDLEDKHEVLVDDPALAVPPSPPVDPGLGAGFVYPGGAKVSANAVSVPVPSGLDIKNVTAITLTFTGAGRADGPDRIFLADAWMNRETSAVRSL